MNETDLPRADGDTSTTVLTTLSPSLRLIIPHVVAILLLTAIGLGMWRHAMRSEQFPLYDAAGYVWKAKNVWSGPFGNPLNTEPALRPPGTVLMSFPFGYKEDFRGFHFRSVYFPVIITFLAVYVCIFRWSASLREHCNLALVACTLITLPLFYHFEFGGLSPTYWGLVDCFLASVAALSIACAIRSVRENSLLWLGVAAVSAALCILIKPFGAFVMLVVGLSWPSMMLVKFRFLRSDTLKVARPVRFFLMGLGFMAMVFSLVLAACLLSKYLSLQNVNYFRTAVGVLKADSAVSPSVILISIHYALGYSLVISTACIMFVFLRNLLRRGNLLGDWKYFFLFAGAVAGFLAVCVAGLIWFRHSEFHGVVRYFYLFALMAFICWTPAALHVLGGTRLIVNQVLGAIWGLSAACVMTATLMPNCPEYVQQVLGINVRSGTMSAEVRQARELLSLCEDKQQNFIVYEIDRQPGAAAFETVGIFNKLLRPNGPFFSVRNPVDWQRPSTYRLEEIVESDYISFTPIPDDSGGRDILARKKVTNIHGETGLFRAWFTNLGRQNGVELVSETSMKLLKITDRQKLYSNLRAMAQNYDLPETFYRENLQHWVGQDEVPIAPAGNPCCVANVTFQNCYRFERVQVERVDSRIQVKIWFSKLAGPPAGNWSIFTHILDAGGNIIAQRGIDLSAICFISDDKPVRLEVQQFGESFIEKNGRNFAFGICSSSQNGPQALMADSGNRDWDNRRVLVPFPR